MKAFMESDGVWKELLPSGLRSPTSDLVTETETPNSTITTEHSKNYLIRMRAQELQKTLTFSGSTKLGANDGQTSPLYRTIDSIKQTKIFPGRIKKRVVLKNGNVNLCKEHIDKRSKRYLQDLFTTMVDIQWRWNLLVFAMGFILSWLGFSVLWWLICFSHSDFDNLDNNEWIPCVMNVKSFTSAFLFSIETQHTIGYGSRYTTEECPEAIFVMCMQSVVGVMIQCFMVGFVFAKLSRPQKRSQTLMFSRNAIVCLRDSKLCLMFRICDVRNRSHIIGASVSAQIISRKVTQEGEVISYYHTYIPVKFDNSNANVLLIWPATIVHEIDEKSPFYNLSSDEMMREKFEIIVILEGTIESTGQSVQARSSYLPSEILWGHRFEQLVSYRRESGEYRVDYGRFNNTYEVDTPLCSAKDYYKYQQFIAEQQNSVNRNINFIEFVPKRSNSDETRAHSTDCTVCSINGNTIIGSSLSNRQLPENTV
ncbi:G protein-activated inward rectifier potassium channel 3-like [Oppia nitens]|uniref:G protein-activated inward rectifier potassium channel 3-like n=1 Tax=Oppia nitens TaxID=1686743 RepID=UPI0023DBE1D4|nr:G protein-activated inward rectifier potassium channel 3-like [Oppia nitens]